MEDTLEVRERIVRAGRDLFAARGYAAIGVDDVAAAADTARSAVYQHFEDKRGLFRAVFEAVEQDLAEQVARGAAAETDPWEQMRAGTRALLEACCDLAVRRIVLIDGPSVLGWEEWRRIDSRFAFGMVRAALEANVAAGNLAEPSLDALTHLYVGSLNEAGLVVAAADDRAARLEEFMATLDRVMNAQRVRRPSAPPARSARRSRA